MSISLILAVAALGALPEPDNDDIFPGTLSVEAGSVVLRRCSLGDDLYVLRDAKGAHAVADYGHDKRPGSAQVIGAYAQEQGGHVLYVKAIEDFAPGKSCHLVDALSELAAPIPAKAPSFNGQAGFIGHYYLSGVSEVGAELQLDADGHFAWFMAYGAVDQVAHGRWRREKGEIVLSAERPRKDKPLLTYRDTVPWNRQAEEALAQIERGKAIEAMRAACPFDTSDWAATAMARMPVPEGADPAQLRQNAKIALAAAHTARSRVEALARTVMAQPLPQRSAAAEQITKALQDWLTARDEAQQSAYEAGQSMPEIEDPQLPPACTMPAEPLANDPKSWLGGFAVQIEDQPSGTSLSRGEVSLRLADGTVLKSSGKPLWRGPFASPVNEVSVTVPFAAGRIFTFALAPVQQGIVRIDLDAAQLIEPPFDSMRLRIDGETLAPNAKGSARYVRQR